VALGGDLPELQRESGLSPYGLLRLQHGLAIAHLGRPAEAIAVMEEASALARERGENDLAAFAHVCRVVPCDLLGDVDRILMHGRRAVEVAEIGSSPWLRALARSAFGHGCLANGRYEEAIEALASVVATLDERNATPLVESQTAALLAEARLGAGDVAGALATADAAIERARTLHRPVAELRAHLARARVLVASDADARAALDAAAALVERTGARAYAAFVHAERGRSAERRGDVAGREREAAEARRLLGEMGVRNGTV
jgi:tetratricopeptide (TPR) repeat protein